MSKYGKELLKARNINNSDFRFDVINIGEDKY